MEESREPTDVRSFLSKLVKIYSDNFKDANTFVTEIEKGNTDHLESFVVSMARIEAQYSNEMDQLINQCISNYDINVNDLEQNNLHAIRSYLKTWCEH